MSGQGSLRRGSVQSGNCLVGDVSIAEMSVRDFSSGKCQSGNYLVKKLSYKHFPHFWEQKYFFQKIHLWHNTLWALILCWVPEKNKELIPRKRPDRTTDLIERTLLPMANKRISQLRGIAVDSKNKIQFNASDHASLTKKSC